MELPLVLSSNMSHAVQMVIAIFIGIGFGFTLERAGFGRADNLAAIFYGRDFRVMRVMFTAIVVAMLGVYFLDLIGIMPIENLGLLPTYFLPQMVGGMILGFGFIIGGYCPGTSIVGSMSGKIDALFFVGGLFLGGLLFTVSYDFFAEFHASTFMDRILLNEFFGIPSALMVMIVLVFAVGALWAVTKIETKVNASLAKQGGNND